MVKIEEAKWRWAGHRNDKYRDGQQGKRMHGNLEMDSTRGKQKRG